jgi:hypothetical protein
MTSFSWFVILSKAKDLRFYPRYNSGCPIVDA